MANDDATGLARTARLDVLFTGYAADHVAGTVTHLWWTEQGPLALRAQRERVLALADLVVPGHGPAFKP